MNKKEQYAKQAKRGCGRPADVLDTHPLAKVLCEDEKDGNGPQKVQIGRQAFRHCQAGYRSFAGLANVAMQSSRDGWQKYRHFTKNR
jgi:hypothetical protein